MRCGTKGCDLPARPELAFTFTVEGEAHTLHACAAHVLPAEFRDSDRVEAKFREWSETIQDAIVPEAAAWLERQP